MYGSCRSSASTAEQLGSALSPMRDVGYLRIELENRRKACLLCACGDRPIPGLAKDILPAGGVVAEVEMICRRAELLERLGNLMAGLPGIDATDQ